MRIVKEHEERKSEILDAAEQLFAARGYEAATVNDILGAVKIAKGTFYYYFKSKEEVLDTFIERSIGEGLQKAEEITASPFRRWKNCLR
jgi:AcrR family transcriptional regulator